MERRTRMKTLAGSKTWKLLAVAVGALGLLALPGPARADTLLVNQAAAHIEVGGTTGEISYEIQNTGGDDGPISPSQGQGQGGRPVCNVSLDNPATVTLALPAGVTASSATLTFTACDSPQLVTFSASIAGAWDIEPIISGGIGRIEAHPHRFKLKASGPADLTPPVVVATVTGTPGDNGWYTSDVSVSWTISDPESPVTSQPCGTTTIDVDTAGQTVTCAATSGGGTTVESVTIKRDATKPTIALSVPATVLLNGVIAYSAVPSDATSGLASFNCNVPATSSVGSKVIACTASDNAGNRQVESAGFNVVYDFSGFLQPIPLPVSTFKAGSNVPVKFALRDANGVAVGTASAIVSAPGASGIAKYDAAAGQYHFNYKTPLNLSGNVTISVVPGDGTIHSVTVTLRK